MPGSLSTVGSRKLLPMVRCDVALVWPPSLSQLARRALAIPTPQKLIDTLIAHPEDLAGVTKREAALRQDSGRVAYRCSRVPLSSVAVLPSSSGRSMAFLTLAGTKAGQTLAASSSSFTGRCQGGAGPHWGGFVHPGGAALAAGRNSSGRKVALS